MLIEDDIRNELFLPQSRSYIIATKNTYTVLYEGITDNIIKEKAKQYCCLTMSLMYTVYFRRLYL